MSTIEKNIAYRGIKYIKYENLKNTDVAEKQLITSDNSRTEIKEEKVPRDRYQTSSKNEVAPMPSAVVVVTTSPL